MLVVKHVLLLIAAVAASPVAEPVTANPASDFCTVVKGLVTKAKAQPQATPYCSSYLSIKPVVATANVKSTIYTSTVVTTVPSFTVTEYKTSTVIQPTVVGVPPTGTCSAAAVKRGVTVVPKPSCFATYTAAPIISSACKCLSIPAPTSTSTIVATVKAIFTSTQNTITQTEYKYETKYEPTTTTNPHFHIRATGSAVTGLAGTPVFYVYDQGSKGIPFDNGESLTSRFRLDDECKLLLLEGEEPFISERTGGAFPGYHVVFGDYVTSGEEIKCSVSAGSGLQCRGFNGETVNSICPDDRYRADRVWVLDKQANCDSEAFGLAIV